MQNSRFSASSLMDRSVMNRTIREFFGRLGYLEAETPLLTPNPIPESHIELFRTERLGADGSLQPLYLVPSAEVWLKLLLASGAPPVFQIGRCFRNGEQLDRWHRPEFSMLEWYSPGAAAEDNLVLMKQLLDAVVQATGPKSPREITGKFRLMSMDEAFRQYAGFSLGDDLRQAGLDSVSRLSPDYPAALSEAASRLEARLTERGLPAGSRENQEADDFFHRLFITLVEDRLPTDVPLALTDWPMLVPTLARRIPGTPWSERWELYIRGVEVANCYGEENNPEFLDAYWKAEAPKKEVSEIPVFTGGTWPEDVGGGMPACSGAAVGLDRLLALVRGEESLEGLDLFPIRDMMPR